MASGVGKTLGDIVGDPSVDTSSSLANPSASLVGLERPDRAVASASSFLKASSSRSNLMRLLIGL